MLRRFAVIEVIGPPADQLRAALHEAAGGDPNAAHAAERLLPLADLAPLGAGVFLDAARHAAARRAVAPTDDVTLAREAYAAYVAPLLGDLDEDGERRVRELLGVLHRRHPAALIALARHGEAIATARAFQERSGAQRVVLLLDRGDGEADDDRLRRDERDRGHRGRRESPSSPQRRGPGAAEAAARDPARRPRPRSRSTSRPASCTHRSARSSTSRTACSRWRARSAA